MQMTNVKQDQLPFSVMEGGIASHLLNIDLIVRWWNVIYIRHEEVTVKALSICPLYRLEKYSWNEIGSFLIYLRFNLFCDIWEVIVLKYFKFQGVLIS